MLKGAPFAALSQKRVESMIALINPEKGKKMVDLGSGDGRIVLAFAKKGIQTYGYEINPLLYLISKLKVKREGIKYAKIILSDYWKEDLSQFDYVTVWGTPYMMERLEKKIKKESKPGTLIVSNHLTFPNLKYIMKKDDVFLYKIS